MYMLLKQSFRIYKKKTFSYFQTFYNSVLTWYDFDEFTRENVEP